MYRAANHCFTFLTLWLPGVCWCRMGENKRARYQSVLLRPTTLLDRIPNVPALVAVSLALVAGQWFSALHFHPMPLVPLLMMPVLSLLAFFGDRAKRSVIPISAAFFFLGSWQVSNLVHPAVPFPIREVVSAALPVEIVGKLGQSPTRVHYRGRLRLENASITSTRPELNIPGALLLTVNHLNRQWQRGDLVRVKLRLREPRNFQNPGSLDYRGLLAIRGIYFTGALQDDREINLISRSPSGLTSLFDRVRVRIGHFVDTHLVGTRGELLKALMIGETGGIPAELWRKFSLTGVVHVLSISGLHVSMFSILTFFLVQWMGSRSTFVLLQFNLLKIGALMSLFPMLFYVGIAGASTPAIRSAVMVAAYLLAILLDRESEVLSSLALAALVISLVWPGSIMEISFQLSFASVLAIVLAVNRTRDILKTRRERDLATRFGLRISLWDKGVLYGVVSLAAIFGTAPLVAYHFNQFSLAGVFANPLVAPLVGFGIVPVGMLVSVFSLILPSVSNLFLPIASFLITLLIGLVDFFSSWTWAFTHIPAPTAMEIATFYIFLASLFRVNKTSGRVALVLSACLLLSVETYLYVATHQPRGRLRITFLDVGAGESSVIELPKRGTLVVDGGGILGEDFDIGRVVVAKYLWANRITRLDAVMMTAPLLHHFGGLQSLVELFPLKEFWSTAQATSGQRFASLERTLETQKVQRVQVSKEKRCRVMEDVIICATEAGPQNTMALQLFYGKTEILLLSDGRQRTQRAPGDELWGGNPTVLKIPGHTAWQTDSLRPGLKIITGRERTGRDAPPKPPFENRVPTFTTAREGAITVESDGIAIGIQGFKGRTLYLKRVPKENNNVQEG